MAKTFDEGLAALAEKRIDEAIAAHTKNIIAGQMTERVYMQATGAIRGLAEAKVLIGEALSDIMKG